MIGRRNAGETASLWEQVGLGSPEETAWMADALCAQTDPEVFFPQKGGSTRPAKSVCLACPVRDECATYALDHRQRYGVWGGLSERERRSALRKQATDAIGEVAA